MQKPVIILGIDPGTLLMGYSVIEAYKNTFSIKTIDVLKLSSKKDHYQRLQMIHQKITELVEEFSPNEFAIEAPFFGKNVQSMLKLGRAQGVAIAAAMTKNIPVTEYSPRKIKQSITGNGNADKEQVWKMLQRITALPDKPKHYDATDALAVSICHYFGTKNLSEKKPTGAKKSSGWEKFIQQNPERILKMR
ncbi:MAG TPA: crossover junction endodeoxyribonuclease RuvC [Flavisolibacter sp.]|nr:crossover junction endodeoxyribonuclease RuvC [Flavisolibacter sp.]